MKAVIIVAGIGKRLLPLTKDISRFDKKGYKNWSDIILVIEKKKCNGEDIKVKIKNGFVIETSQIEPLTILEK